MPNASFDIDWDVELINQPTDMSCWAASAAMVVGWRDRISIQIEAIVGGTGDWAAYKNGINPANVPALAAAWNLTQEAPKSYTVDGMRDLLGVGPVWVGAAVPNLHAIVVTGMYSDGDYDNTFIRINDPWDRDPGTPGAVGAYKRTHLTGSQYVLSFQQFCEEYEAATSFKSVTVQILRTLGRSS
jgi:papain like cysteine protease AvrRpt2